MSTPHDKKVTEKSSLDSAAGITDFTQEIKLSDRYSNHFGNKTPTMSTPDVTLMVSTVDGHQARSDLHSKGLAMDSLKQQPGPF